MSYILEALKKSEKERRKDGVPDLQADHSQLPSRRPTRKPISGWLAGVVVLLLLGGGSLFWWQGQRERASQPPEEKQLLSPLVISPPPASRQVSVVSEPPPKSVSLSPEIREQSSKEVGEPVKEAEEQSRSLPSPVAEGLVEENREQIAQEVHGAVTEVEEQRRSVPPPVNEAVVEEKEPQLPEALPLLEELSPGIRNKIPPLSFAGHAYAEDTGRRLIIINNRIVRERDLISSGLSLEQITPDGVVLRYQAVVFQVKLF